MKAKTKIRSYNILRGRSVFSSQNRRSEPYMAALEGFTIMELCIAMVLLLIAMGGISLVYLTTENMYRLGTEGFHASFSDMQRKSISPEEFMSRRIRLSYWAGVEDSGDTLIIDVSNNKDRDGIVKSRFYFVEDALEEGRGSIFYDPDVLGLDDEREIYKSIYRTTDEDGTKPIFSINEDLPRVIEVNFGYFQGGSVDVDDFQQVEFKAKMRNI